MGMTTPRKRAPGAGRKRLTPAGMERHTVTLPPDLWAHVDAQQGGTRSERLRLVVRRDADLLGLAEDERLSRYYDWYYSVGIGGE
jgi:hypothetical protein